jgi:hypothetical protein
MLATCAWQRAQIECVCVRERKRESARERERDRERERARARARERERERERKWESERESERASEREKDTKMERAAARERSGASRSRLLRAHNIIGQRDMQSGGLRQCCSQCCLMFGKRDLLQRQARPTTAEKETFLESFSSCASSWKPKETYYRGQKRPTTEAEETFFGASSSKPAAMLLSVLPFAETKKRKKKGGKVSVPML